MSPHSFRLSSVPDLLTQGVPLEDVQYLAGHSSPRTTRLYDRRQTKVTRNVVERISIWNRVFRSIRMWLRINRMGPSRG